MITRTIKKLYYMQTRSHKNFGHKPVPTARVTVYWSCFLVFNMVALMLDWKKIGRFVFGDAEEELLDDLSLSNQTKIESTTVT